MSPARFACLTALAAIVWASLPLVPLVKGVRGLLHGDLGDLLGAVVLTNGFILTVLGLGALQTLAFWAWLRMWPEPLPMGRRAAALASSAAIGVAVGGFLGVGALVVLSSGLVLVPWFWGFLGAGGVYGCVVGAVLGVSVPPLMMELPRARTPGPPPSAAD